MISYTIMHIILHNNLFQWLKTPLHYAAEGGHCDLVKTLIHNESDLLIEDIVSQLISYLEYFFIAV